MNDQGLSIFDDEPDTAETGGPDAEETRAMPVVPDHPAAQPVAETTRRTPVVPPAAPRAAAARPASAPVLPPAAPTSAAVGLPVVRRGGYDRAAVDARLRDLAAEQAALRAHVGELEQRAAAAQAELEQAVHELRAGTFIKD